MSSLDYRKNPAVRYSFLWILLLPLLALLFSPPPAHADGGFPIIGVLHAGQRPEGIAVDTETHMVYIAYEFPSLVVGFDLDGARWRSGVPHSDELDARCRGRIALRSYIGRLRTQGEKLTLAEIELPKPPKDGNGPAALMALTNQFDAPARLPIE